MHFRWPPIVAFLHAIWADGVADADAAGADEPMPSVSVRAAASAAMYLLRMGCMAGPYNAEPADLVTFGT
jgi:hypothetical protein